MMNIPFYPGLLTCFRVLTCLLLATVLPMQSGLSQVPVFDYAYAFGTTVPYTQGTVMADQSATDAAGNVYVTGIFNRTATFGSFTLTNSTFSNTLFVAKLSPAGQWLWAVQAGGNQAVAVGGIALDNAGNVYLSGGAADITFGSLTLSTAGAQDAFVAKLSANGQWLWAVAGGGAFSDFSYGLAVDGSGSAYITGALSSWTASFGNSYLSSNSNQGIGIFVAKVSSAGVWQWATATTHTSPTVTNAGQQVAVAADGSLYVAGEFHSATLTLGRTTLTNAAPGTISNDVFVAKLTPAGQWQWAMAAGGTGRDFANGLVLGTNGALYLAGEFESPAISFGSTALGTSSSNAAAYVAKLTTGGTWLWATQSGLSGGASGSSFARGLAVGADGSAFVCGFCYGRPRFGNSVPAGVTQDVLVAKLTPAGQWDWALRVGSPNGEIAHGISLDPSGNAYLTGAFGGPSLSFGAITLTNPTMPTNNLGFVARLAAAAPTATAAAAGGAAMLRVWPNPARLTAVVELPTPAAALHLEVLDALGRVARRQLVVAGATQVPLSLTGLTSGMYVVRYGGLARQLIVE